ARGSSDGWGQRLIPKAAPDAHRLDRLERIVDTHDLCSLLDRFDGEGDAAAQAPIDRGFARERPDRPFAAGADDQRASQRLEQCEAVHQLEIVGDILAEAEAGIDENVLAPDARLDHGLDPPFEPQVNLD